MYIQMKSQDAILNEMYISHVLNVAVQWLALFLHILEISNMNLVWETGCVDYFYGFSQSRQVL